MTQGWRIWHNEQVHNLHPSHIVRMVKEHTVPKILGEKN